MSVVRDFFERIKAIGPEVGAELSRQGTQGASELAGALFNGHAYVPYGEGQHVTHPEAGVGSPEPPSHEAQAEQERERGGREM